MLVPTGTPTPLSQVKNKGFFLGVAKNKISLDPDILFPWSKHHLPINFYFASECQHVCTIPN
jgi:hypothetical protein